MLSALRQRHLPVLVVAPKRVAETVWHEEAAIWRPDLKVVRAIGTPAKRRAALADRSADVIVLGRDNLADAAPYARFFNTLVLDELSGFKNRATNRWTVASKLAWADHRLGVPEIPVVWGLTGTPSPNGLMDLWAEIFLLDGGERLEDGITKYRNRYFYPERVLPNGIVAKYALRQGSADRIHGRLADLCLSMSAEAYLRDLPPITYNHVNVQIPSESRRVYAELKDEMVADLGGAEVVTAASAAVVYNKLSQVTAGFLYLTHEDNPKAHPVRALHQSKLDALAEILDGTGSPVLVFYRYQAERDAILKRFPDLAHTVDERDIVSRWNAGQIPLLLAHPASAGHGLNLQKGPGHTAVWTTLPWSLEEWHQANRRLARQGQKAAVMVHILEVPGSVDGYVLDVLAGKTTIERALLDALALPRRS